LKTCWILGTNVFRYVEQILWPADLKYSLAFAYG
jgi:hypothetical protein